MSIGSYDILRNRVAPHPFIDPRATYVVLEVPVVNEHATQVEHVQAEF
jgi:hypothetical protein